MAQPIPRVLVIDDELPICRSIARALRGANVVTYTNAREALERLSPTDRFDLILCDMMMPEMSGIAFYNEVRDSRPDLLPRMYIMTGGACSERTQEFLDQIGSAQLEKPLDGAKLRELARAIGLAERPAASARR